MKYLKQNAGYISWCTRWARRPRLKAAATTLYTPYLAEIWKILILSFTFCVLALLMRSKHNNNKALCITLNSCKTVSTYSMTLATVNIDKIIKVTSASSYVFRFYTLTSVCVRALPVGHFWQQAKRRVWSLSCWILFLSTVSYRKYLF